MLQVTLRENVPVPATVAVREIEPPSFIEALEAVTVTPVTVPPTGAGTVTLMVDSLYLVVSVTEVALSLAVCAAATVGALYVTDVAPTLVRVPPPETMLQVTALE